MNKAELIELIAADADLSKAASARALDAVINNVTAAVAKGESVALIGFGTFKPTMRAARVGKNPKTGEQLTIPATTVPKFVAGTAFKAAVANK